MLEVIALAIFAKKIRSIAEEKNIEPKKWLIRLVLFWFGIEIVTIVAFIYISGDSSKDTFIMGSFIGIGLALISAFYNLAEMKKETVNLNE